MFVRCCSTLSYQFFETACTGICCLQPELTRIMYTFSMHFVVLKTHLLIQSQYLLRYMNRFTENPPMKLIESAQFTAIACTGVPLHVPLEYQESCSL